MRCCLGDKPELSYKFLFHESILLKMETTIPLNIVAYNVLKRIIDPLTTSSLKFGNTFA